MTDNALYTGYLKMNTVHIKFEKLWNLKFMFFFDHKRFNLANYPVLMEIND